jgi:hypothetical protein
MRSTRDVNGMKSSNQYFSAESSSAVGMHAGRHQSILMMMISISTTVVTGIIGAALIVLSAVSTAFAEARTPGDFIITAGTLNVRIAPDTTAKVTDKLYRQQQVEVFEIDDGWARISPYYDGEAEGVPGNVARWVFAMHLSAQPRTDEKTDVGSPVAEAIKSSEDLEKYRGLFVSVSRKLIDSGECKLSDFADIGGWWRSIPHKSRPVYYVYCGAGSSNHVIYVDAASGETFR